MCFSPLRHCFCSQGKLDSYKKLVDEGQTLNDDQKVCFEMANFLRNFSNVAENE